MTPNRNLATAATLFSIVALSGLSACGGGSGTTDPAANGPAPAASTPAPAASTPAPAASSPAPAASAPAAAAPAGSALTIAQASPAVHNGALTVTSLSLVARAPDASQPNPYCAAAAELSLAGGGSYRLSVYWVPSQANRVIFTSLREAAAPNWLVSAFDTNGITSPQRVIQIRTAATSNPRQVIFEALLPEFLGSTGSNTGTLNGNLNLPDAPAGSGC